MSDLENPMVAGLSRYYSRQDRDDMLTEQAYEVLRAEMVHALTNDPTIVVETPGYAGSPCNLPREAAFEVIGDDLGADSLIELLRIVGLAARGEECQLRASAWIAAQAKKHADFNADDMAELLRGDE